MSISTITRKPLTSKQARRVKVLHDELAWVQRQLAVRTAHGRELDGSGARYAAKATALRWALDQLGRVFEGVERQETPIHERVEAERTHAEQLCAKRVVCHACGRSRNCARAPNHTEPCDGPARVSGVHCAGGQGG